MGEGEKMTRRYIRLESTRMPFLIVKRGSE